MYLLRIEKKNVVFSESISKNEEIFHASYNCSIKCD